MGGPYKMATTSSRKTDFPNIPIFMDGEVKKIPRVGSLVVAVADAPSTLWRADDGRADIVGSPALRTLH